jgi:hypothetical protein
MIGKWIRSLFARWVRKSFNADLEAEIYGRLFPHLEHETNEGYPFINDAEMIAQTETLEGRQLLEGVERQIENMPDAYGQCFRYLMRKDIHERLQLYAALAKRRARPATIDPRFVAKHA